MSITVYVIEDLGTIEVKKHAGVWLDASLLLLNVRVYMHACTYIYTRSYIELISHMTPPHIYIYVNFSARRSPASEPPPVCMYAAEIECMD